MPNFKSGVKRYITAVAVVEVNFPVDWHDRADVSCRQCQFFVRATGRCGLNQHVVAYPEKYVGDECPLTPIDESKAEKE
jgi:hypothetical protein